MGVPVLVIPGESDWSWAGGYDYSSAHDSSSPTHSKRRSVRRSETSTEIARLRDEVRHLRESIELTRTTVELREEVNRLRRDLRPIGAEPITAGEESFMSTASYESYSDRMNEARLYSDSNREVREEAWERRRSRMRGASEKAAHEPARAHAKVPEPIRVKIDASLARTKITTPPKKAAEAHVILVDNSGSNAAIAESLKRSAGYLHAVCAQIAGDASLSMIFFSDHCDGDLIFQEADWTTPGKTGENVLRASIDQIRNASGGDEPEAIECALLRASELDFGHISKEKRYLYLVSDQVAHGMGYDDGSDSGCPQQKDWKKSLKKVHENYGSFQVVASGQDREVFNLQKKFLAENRLQYDLMDLATGRLTHEERCRLVTNALLLFVARNRGFQTVSTFLMILLEKWLAEPQYGSDTLRRARAQIEDFCQYLEVSDKKKAELLKQIFAGVDQEK
jgi:hypothetical protein